MVFHLPAKSHHNIILQWDRQGLQVNYKMKSVVWTENMNGQRESKE